MKTKTIIFLGAAALVLSSAMAFTFRAERTADKKEAASAQTTEQGGGFALEDQDEWK